MFRRVLFVLLLIAGASLATPRAAEADNFSNYAYYGTVYAYYGTQYNYQTLRIATESDFQNGAIENAYYYSYYSFIYGYYGLEYGYADYIQYAGDLANAAKEYSKGIFDYTYYTLLPEYPYPPIQAVAENSYNGWICMAYAEVYFDTSYNYAFNKPPKKNE
ncbi:MAG TPA: hypothetical protein VGN57_17265 [Pirellulaceae bacterium]|jgi:hypothetical protein|nr:hypothetical protein [Pirellulaceae bacterium]